MKQGWTGRMDSDIKHIIEEEQKLVQLVEESKIAAREKVEQHRNSAAKFRESEFSRITGEFKIIGEKKLHEVKIRMENELKEMKSSREHLLDEPELRNKITGRIVSVILENRT